MKLKQKHKDVIEGKICPYCQSKTKVVHVANVPDGVVGANYFFACNNYPVCDSYTIGKLNSFEPQGRLANRALREERTRAYKNVNILKNKWEMTDIDIANALSEKLEIPMEYMHICSVNISNCKKITGWAIRHRLHLEYEHTGVYTNISARRSIDGKKLFKRCIIVENLNQKSTLVEFDDGYRAISTQVRVTKR